MKIVKIGAIWCGACLIMNKVWKQMQENYDFEAIELDYDMDEEKIEHYSPGDTLPVFIFFLGDKEVKRVIGEHSFLEMEKVIKEVLDSDKKN